MKKRALYAGSFDPVTYGHIDIIKRASSLFQEVFVGVAWSFSKKGIFSFEERKSFLEQVVKEANLGNVVVCSFDSLTVDFAKKHDIQVLVRGLRAISDFDAEFQLVLTNRHLDPQIETVFLMSSQEHFYLSSHLVKEIVNLGGSAAHFVPPFVETALRKKMNVH